MKKTFLGLVTLLFTSFSFAQPSVSFELQTRGVGMSAGMVFNRVEMNVGYNAPLSRKSTIPYIFYTSAGYSVIHSNDFVIVPAIGYSLYHEESEKGDVLDVGAFLSSIEAGKNFNTRSGNDGRYYLFIRQSKKLFAGAGLKIFID